MTELSDDRLYKRFKEAQKQQTPTSSFGRDIKIEGHDLQYLRIMVHYKYKVTIHTLDSKYFSVKCVSN